MKQFTYSDAHQRFAELLDRAGHDGAVRIRRRDGRVFVLRPEMRRGSPLDVEGVALRLATGEIVESVREGRRPA